ncbi:hypothetical protein O972_03720 [Mycobacterium avium subsp. avium 10-9275]|nr:hypothetical protein P863_04610 [Mycobacterium avium subsp. silvaticum ATCC 49884]ETB20447.1 hypothetical protein O972_03720 [Mycobacterium avium subsp. avium 10-9275]ETB23575.1 hypothetical protein O973_03510 [Mycobacterium avium subsp. avium 11-4751]
MCVQDRKGSAGYGRYRAPGPLRRQQRGRGAGVAGGDLLSGARRCGGRGAGLPAGRHLQPRVLGPRHRRP